LKVGRRLIDDSQTSEVDVIKLDLSKLHPPSKRGGSMRFFGEHHRLNWVKSISELNLVHRRILKGNLFFFSIGWKLSLNEFKWK
jgi:hypothetical protein